MGYQRIKKTREMAKVFNRKSGEHKSKRHKPRKTEKTKWQKEIYDVISEKRGATC